MHVTIDRAGAVKDARVVEGHPMLRAAAVIAAPQWKFEEDAAQERVATLKFSLCDFTGEFKGAGANSFSSAGRG